MRTPRTLASLVAVAALTAAFITTAKADSSVLGRSFAAPLSAGLTPAEKSRLSQEELKALARRSLHRFTPDELSKLKKCQEYSHLKPEDCDPMIVAANLAEARSIIAAGLPESKRAGYEKLIRSGSSPKLDAYLAGIPLPVPATGAPVASKPQPNVGKTPRKPRAAGAVTQKPQTGAEPQSEQNPPTSPVLGQSPVPNEPSKKDLAGMNISEFKALPLDERKSLCAEFLAKGGGAAAATDSRDTTLEAANSSFQDCFKEKDLAECTSKISVSKKTDGAPQKSSPTVDPSIAAACKLPNFGDEISASSGGKQPSLAGSVPDLKKIDCDPDKIKDGKCPEGKKADPNEWLAVKTGAVGMVPGMMIGSFFPGFVPLAIGAAVGFALFWGLSKLTN